MIDISNFQVHIFRFLLVFNTVQVFSETGVSGEPVKGVFLGGLLLGLLAAGNSLRCRVEHASGWGDWGTYLVW